MKRSTSSGGASRTAPRSRGPRRPRPSPSPGCRAVRAPLPSRAFSSPPDRTAGSGPAERRERLPAGERGRAKISRALRPNERVHVRGANPRSRRPAGNGACGEDRSRSAASPMTRAEKVGLSFAFAEVLSVGLVPAFSKYAVARIDPLLYSASAVVVAAALSLALALARGEAGQIVDPAFVVRLVPIALFGTTATTLLLFFCARLTDGVSTALLLQVEPVYSLALTWLLHRRRAPAAQILGTGLVLAGIALVL